MAFWSHNNIHIIQTCLWSSSRFLITIIFNNTRYKYFVQSDNEMPITQGYKNHVQVKCL